jgi:hypothetical protein
MTAPRALLPRAAHGSWSKNPHCVREAKDSRCPNINPGLVTAAKAIVVSRRKHVLLVRLSVACGTTDAIPPQKTGAEQLGWHLRLWIWRTEPLARS